MLIDAPAGGRYPGKRPVIVETIVTTLDVQGDVNCAPMGVVWGEETIVLKPFLATATYRNIVATRVAVVNITDDCGMFAQAAISNPDCACFPAAVVRGVVLADACSWREVEVRTIDAGSPRSRVETRVVHRGTGREFIGFNRAAHAVLEAAIYATRVHLLPRAFLLQELERLQVVVDKTSGPREHAAMRLLSEYIGSAPESALGRRPPSGARVDRFDA